MAEDYRIARLAKQIGDEVKKDYHLLLTDIEILNLRRQGAGQLHSICAGLVASMNRLLAPPLLELVPSTFAPEMFRETRVNIMQLNVKGRIIQITFASTREKFSTEKFLTPYILEGEVRAYNQELLDQSQVRTEALFYCLEGETNRWHYYEWLHGRSGVFGRDELVRLLERLV